MVLMGAEGVVELSSRATLRKGPGGPFRKFATIWGKKIDILDPPVEKRDFFQLTQNFKKMKIFFEKLLMF